jgi:hypothetical protein
MWRKQTIGYAVLLVVFCILGYLIYIQGSGLSDQVLSNVPKSEREQTETDSNSATTNWMQYSDMTFGIQLQYPRDWTFMGRGPSKNNTYNAVFLKGNWNVDPAFANGDWASDTIQIADAADSYDKMADGLINREDILKMLVEGNYEKITISGGEGYYGVEKVQGKSTPTIYLVGDKKIFLMNYNIYDSTKTTLPDAEEIFKQMIGTIKFY